MKTSWRYFCKTSWRCLEGVFQDVLKMFRRRVEDVLKTSWRCFEDVLKTSWGHLGKTSWRCFKKFWKRLEDVLKTSSEDVRLRRTYSSWSRRLENVFKTSSEEEDERRLQDVFKTSSSRRMLAGLFVSLKKKTEKLKRLKAGYLFCWISYCCCAKHKNCRDWK